MCAATTTMKDTPITLLPRLTFVKGDIRMTLDNLMHDLIEIGFSFHDALDFTNQMLWEDCLQREKEGKQ